MASELRQDATTRDWVVIAPGRRQRPHRLTDLLSQETLSVECPFCPGREDETPPEVWRLGSPNDGWRVRVVPNRFPTLAPGGSAALRRSGHVLVHGPYGTRATRRSPGCPRNTVFRRLSAIRIGHAVRDL